MSDIDFINSSTKPEAYATTDSSYAQSVDADKQSAGMTNGKNSKTLSTELMSNQSMTV